MNSFDDNEAGGYGKPPVSGRFQKGVRGHPPGRTKGSHRVAPHEAILGQKVTIRENGAAREMSVQEAFMLRLLELALKGNNAAARAIETLEEEYVSVQLSDETSQRRFAIHFAKPGSVNIGLEPLKMGTILDRYREASARVALEPWLIKAALERLGDRRLSRAEQEEVLQATRTPKKVDWPDWWEVLPE